jgi:hypothetical protein
MSQKLYDQLINSPQGLNTGTLRDVILPAILGKETDEMLYWIGKDLARQYPVATTNDLVTLTQQLAFGELTLLKKTATSQIWRLGGPVIVNRVSRDDEETSFGLECGFLAQEVEFQLNTIVEAKVNDRHHDYVEILLENDPQTKSSSERNELVTFIHLQGAQAEKQPEDEKERPSRLQRLKRGKKKSKEK